MSSTAEFLMGFRDILPKGLAQRREENNGLKMNNGYTDKSAERFVETKLNKNSYDPVNPQMVADFLRLMIKVKKNQRTILHRDVRRGWLMNWAVKPGDVSGILGGGDWTNGQQRTNKELRDVQRASRIFNARRMPGCFINYRDREWTRDYINNQIDLVDKPMFPGGDTDKISDFKSVVEKVTGVLGKSIKFSSNG